VLFSRVQVDESQGHRKQFLKYTKRNDGEQERKRVKDVFHKVRRKRKRNEPNKKVKM